MVEVGSIQIGGSIQTAEIERGLKSVEKGFTSIETKGKGVNADFERMNQQSKRLAITFGAMALAGGGAMVAMAKGSPAVAGAMAKIKVESGKLSRSLGEALKPAFDKAAEGFSTFVGWIQENKGDINSFVIDQLERMESALSGISSFWSDISGGTETLLKKVGIDFDITAGGKSLLSNLALPAIAGIVSKLVLGKVLPGIAGPAAIGIAGLTGIATGGTYTQAGGLTGLTIGGVFGGPVGAGIGAGVGVLIGSIIDLLMAGQNRKDQTLNQTDSSMGGF